MWNRETVSLHVCKYKVLKNSLCSELNHYKVERKCSYGPWFQEKLDLWLHSQALTQHFVVQTLIGRMVDKSKKPRH